MKKKAIRKEFFIELKKSFNRFISIFFIAALGVAFFSGIRAAEPDMKLSADRFYDESQLMDIRILGTLGLTKEDVEILKKVEGVERAEGAYSKDVLCQTKDMQLVIKMMSLPKELNQIIIKDGRMPQNAKECIVDTAFLQQSGYIIGDTITIKSGTEDSLEDALSENTFEIVGSCATSYYLSLERGSTTIGNGIINSFIMVSEESFSYETFTEIYVLVKGAKELLCYSEEYENTVETVVKRMETEIQKEREQARYNKIKKDALKKVADVQEELEEAEQETKKKLEDAWQKLLDGKKEIADGKTELAENKKKLTDGKKEIQDGTVKLKDARDEISANKAKLTKAEAEIAKGEQELVSGKKEYKDKKKEYEDGITALEESKKQLDATEQQLVAGGEELEAAKLDLQEKEASGMVEEEVLEAIRIALSEKEIELETANEQLAAGKKEWEKNKAILDESNPLLEQAKSKIETSEKMLQTSKQEIKDGKKKISDGEKEIIEKEKELKQAETDLIDGEKKLEEATKTLKQAETDLQEGQTKYKDSKIEAEQKIADAKEEIAKEEEKISDIKMAKWYILDRNTVQTYVEYHQDAERIGAVGEVFPIIFFLVAALVSLTTMTRMVEEQRTQIGILKALGYGKITIASKYVGYAFLATLGGSLFGGLLGCKVLPLIIMDAYMMMYQNLAVMMTPFNLYYITLATVISVVCILGATAIACWKELTSSPAELMRPAAPKEGKRVLLERIPFIWNRLNFTSKSTVRNLFRYKKRFFMTIFGIGSCMALMLVGFGLKDSIFSIVELQYGKIHLYDAVMELEEDRTGKEQLEIEKKMNEDARIDTFQYQYKNSIDIGKDEVEKTVNLVALKNDMDINPYYRYQGRTNGQKYFLSEKGVILSEKISKLLDVKVGDTIYLKKEEDQKVEVMIEGIAENYVQNYIFMTSTFYETLYGEKIQYNEIILINNGLKEEENNKLAEDLLKYKGVSSVILTKNIKTQFDDMLRNLDIVMVVLIVSAGALAFIVLYNLNNISINERRRELATIKVLGFYDLEVSEYVFRENVILTLVGIGLGVLLGFFLHRYVILTCEIDAIMFGRKIGLLSYVYSGLLTCLFAAFINVSMHFKLKKVDMASSLKSVE